MDVQNDVTIPSEGTSAVEVARNAARFRNGANWFYWIAGLSVVNSLISLFGGGIGFIFGLGATQIVDAIAAVVVTGETPAAGLIRIIALGVTAFCAGILVLFGWLANQRQGWAFLIGMVLYLLDGLLILYVGDPLSAGFHAFALFCMFQGYMALRRLNTQTPSAPSQGIQYGPQV